MVQRTKSTRLMINNCSKVITEKSRPQGTALIIPPAQAAI